MLTVVYCTREHNQKFYNHISKTVGVSKVKIIEDINEGVGLPIRYNKYIEESENDLIVFIHDDLIFNTKNWGKKIISHFKKSDYGILGLAGTTDIPESGRWWEDQTKMVGIVNHKHDGKIWESKYSNNFGKEIIETVMTDGLFIAIDRTKIKEKFNEEVKWHFYDMYFTFKNHLAGVKVGVIFDVRVTHLSIGQTNDEWEETRIKFSNEFKEELPYKITPEIRYDLKPIKLKREPKVSIIIPTKSKLDLLFQTIDSIYDESAYNNMEILVADTGSSDEEIEKIKDFINGYTFKSDMVYNIKLIEYDYYNFAKINNDVVKNHVSDDTELLLFCNNDIKLLNDVITRMVNVYLKNKNVGTIGCRLHYGDNSIQHSGVIAISRDGKNFGVTHHGLKSYYRYYDYREGVLGNTAALMMTSKSLFEKIGGFNENYIECLEDVEYNVKCITNGYRNIFIGDAVAYHYESQSRNDDPEKDSKFQADWLQRLQPLMASEEKIIKLINKF